MSALHGENGRRSLSENCRAAVFIAAGRPLEHRTVPLPRTMPPGSALVRVRLATICGSDLHTFHGRRTEPAPLILGHEIVGEIVETADGAPELCGPGPSPVPGDRITWTIMARCGSCFFCTHGLPQKCLRLRKYGHTSIDEPPGLFGGFAEYAYLFPGTVVHRIPGSLPDEAVVTANCALATAVNAVEAAGIEEGDDVLVQGAGLMGLFVIALSRRRGARFIAAADVNPARFETARSFGADACIDVSGLNAEEAAVCMAADTARGFDAVIEACGDPGAVPAAVEALRTGGRLCIAGIVSKGRMFSLDGDRVTRKCLTIRGIHNYRPEHLAAALDFIGETSETCPLGGIVGDTFPLSRIDEAFALAGTGRHLRVAVDPTR